ncbi:MAG: alpha/beta hydrolase, partial [Anaerolineales bacterium]
MVIKAVVVVLLLVVVVVVVLSLVVSSRGVRYTVVKTVEQDQSLPHFVLDNGVVLHGETFGNPENPTVIAVHGGPGWDYRSLLPIKALSNEYFVVFYDQRGTGLSPRVDDDEMTFEAYLADLDALVDRYSPGRPVNLIGHSFGGQLVSSYVGRHPDKVAGVILAEPGPLTSEMGKHPNFKFPFGVRFALHTAGSWFESRFYSGPDDHARSDYFVGKFFGSFEGKGHPAGGYMCNQETSLEALQHWRLGSTAFFKLGKTYPSGEEGLGFSLVEGVEDFGREVLFLAGSCDVILGAEIQGEQMKYFPNARMVVIDGVG